MHEQRGGIHKDFRVAPVSGSQLRVGKRIAQWHERCNEPAAER